MDADFEPGLAWMVIATDEGGMQRIQDGILLGFSEGTVSFGSAFAFPFFAGAIFSIFRRSMPETCVLQTLSFSIFGFLHCVMRGYGIT